MSAAPETLWSKDDRCTLIAMQAAGATHTEMADALNRTPAAINMELVRHRREGIALPTIRVGRRAIALDMIRVHEMHGAGATPRQIGRALGVSYMTILRRLDKGLGGRATPQGAAEAACRDSFPPPNSAADPRGSAATFLRGR